ncbi:hypothetical protein TNCV_3293921 [Trichonephila clavipes]|nr:hypothetical protein TNCV_3293921 [Trichonephila clavipes]
MERQILLLIFASSSFYWAACRRDAEDGRTINRRRAASSLVRLVEGEQRWESLSTPSMFSLQIEVEPSKIVLVPAWCLKLGLTTGIKIKPFAVINFVDLDLMSVSIRWHL